MAMCQVCRCWQPFTTPESHRGLNLRKVSSNKRARQKVERAQNLNLRCTLSPATRKTKLTRSLGFHCTKCKRAPQQKAATQCVCVKLRWLGDEGKQIEDAAASWSCCSCCSERVHCARFAQLNLGDSGTRGLG